MKCSVRDQKCAHLYHCWGSRRAARGAPGRPTLLLTESTKTFTLRSQTSGQSSSTMAGGNKTHTLCSQTSGVSQGPPQRTPSDPQGITKNAHPVQPNERGPPRTPQGNPRNPPGPPRTLQGIPNGPHETITLCSQTSGDPQGPPQGIPRNHPRFPRSLQGIPKEPHKTLTL